MFAWWGRTVYRYRYIVIAVMVALCLGGGAFGLSLGDHLTQSGFYDEGSESVRASVLADEVYGRDRTGHIVAVLPAPDGKTVDDPDWVKTVTGELDDFVADHPDQVIQWVGYLKVAQSRAEDPHLEVPPVVEGMKTADDKYTFVSIPLTGDDDDTILNHYIEIAPALQEINGGKVQLAGLEPVSDGLTGTIAKDERRMEVLALPMVAVVLFLVFGGVVAAFLPVMVGGLAIAGAMGILRFTAIFGPVHFFAQPAVTLVGLGIAVDYGLFVVSRFREEIAEGYDTEVAVRRTMITAGRTVMFSAVLIAASAVGLLVFPQAFLKSLTYAMIASVMLSAILSITILPAVLGVLGPNVDALGVRTLLRVPFLANWKPSRVYLTWLANLLQKTKTREEVEHEFWGKLVHGVMKRPLLYAMPIVVAMILLIIPLGNLSLGGFSEKYLPPDNPVRMAQEHFDELFPGYRTEQLTVVLESENGRPVTDRQVAEVRNRAMAIRGFTDGGDDETWAERSFAEGGSKDPSVRVIQNGLVNRNEAAKKVDELRAITAPKGVKLLVGGVPALEQDSIHGMFHKMPLMALILLTTTTLLMFLAFGSVVLPIKATVMSVLTLGSTMGILTWIFVDGHMSHLLNFTPTPLTAPVIGMIIAVIFGLSTDYEVFLVSRMVEAREQGMSTTEAIRIGTAATGRIITAAALVLAVVAGSFVFSDLVMMKYLAFGLMAALLLDATVIRMFLVPSVMKLLGDDCWWAPRWMKRVQERIGLGEIHLPDERRSAPTRPTRATVGAGAGAEQPAEGPDHPHDPTRPAGGHDDARDAGDESGRAADPPEAPTTRFPASTATERFPSVGKTERLNTADGPATNGTTERLPGAGATERFPALDGADREIESWLGQLRKDTSARSGASSAATAPTEHISTNERATTDAATEATRAAGAAEATGATEATEATRATRAQRDAGASGTGRTDEISAQELLRREGRY